MALTRREFLAAGVVGGLGVAALTVPLGSAVQTQSPSRLASSQLPRPYVAAFHAAARYAAPAGAPGFFTVTERQALASPRMLPNLDTRVFGYDGTFPGPTLSVDRVPEGMPTTLRVRNKLPATNPLYGNNDAFNTSVHLHGSPSLPQFDGYANDVTSPAFVKDYLYPNTQAARTLWYHDHAVHKTAKNVYAGLAGQYHLHDPYERGLLPQDEFDVGLTVSDAIFAADGSLAFDDSSHSGLWGDVILVNGQPWPVMQVKRRVYRFRFLNASIARSYRPTLGNGDAVTMVATDAGLMPTAQKVTNWRHGPAERYEFLIDFGKYQAGQRIELRNLSNKNNVNFPDTNKIMAFDVVDGSFDTTNNRVPTTLVTSDVMNLTESDSRKTRHFRLNRDNGMWTIDGKTWDDVIASGFTLLLANPGLGDVEIWEFENSSGGWFHPLHIHLVDFKILSRNGKAPFAYEKGPKDTAYVGEGETVRLIMRFERTTTDTGRYMVHCHNLPHEDHDMMMQYAVGQIDFNNDPNNPMTAARPILDTLP